MSHSRGGLAAFDALIYNSKFSNNYLLSAAYFCNKPSYNEKKSNSVELFNFPRWSKLQKSIVENKDLKINLILGQQDDWLNTCLATAMYIKGSIGQRLLVQYPEGGHNVGVQIGMTRSDQCTRLQHMIWNSDIELKRSLDFINLEKNMEN